MAPIVLLLAGCLSAATLPEQTFPFVLALPDHTPGSFADLGHLSPEPAGAHGPVRIVDGVFVDGRGQRLRFLGTNLTFAGVFPEKEMASAVARRLRQFGFNLIRLHHLDNTTAPRGIWADASQTAFDPNQLDRMDWLISELKANGIYVNINLHVSRTYAGYGINDLPRTFRYGKVLDNFHPELIERQKEYARALLSHRNPYTGTTYAKEPAVAMVEINNENSLTTSTFSPDLLNLPDPLRAPLEAGWREWVKARYGTLDRAVAAWQTGVEPLGDEILTNGDLSDGTTRWTLEAPAPARATMAVVPGAGPEGKPSLRAELTQAGTESWHFQIHQTALDLEEGATYTVTFWGRSEPARTVTVGTRLSKPDWRSLGLSAQVNLDATWRQHRLTFTATRTEPNHARLSFNNSSTLGLVEYADISLRRGAAPDLGAGVTLDNLPLPLRAALLPERLDWYRYVTEVERDYVVQMVSVLKDELGVLAPVTDSQASYGNLAGVMREALLTDYVDMHAYWQHPRFPGVPWDGNNWNIPNTPMSRAADGGTLSRLATHRVAGLPFTVSEYDHPAPNLYAAELFPIIAGYAALQDWDAVMQFTYASSDGTMASDRIGGYFDLAPHPLKMVFAPVAAVMLRGGGVAPLADSTTLRLPTNDWHALGEASGSLSSIWSAAGADRALFAQRRIAIELTDAVTAPVLVGDPGQPIDDDGWLTPRTGPFQWTAGTADDDLLSINGEQAVAVTGALRGRQVSVGPLTIELAATARKHATVALCALDGQPLATSRKLLLVVAGAAVNQDMGWDENLTTVGRRWGTGPVQVEAISGTVSVAGGGYQVMPLDPGGKAGQPLAGVAQANGQTSFQVDPAHQTVWYGLSR